MGVFLLKIYYNVHIMNKIAKSEQLDMDEITILKILLRIREGSQRKISLMSNYSLGKVNQLINQLKTKEYIFFGF